jgi:hypothetical protein
LVPKGKTQEKDIVLNNIQLEVVPHYKYLGFILAPNIDYDAQWSRVQNAIKSIPYLINKLKKLGFRTNILINSYNSYAVSHFTYSALMLTSCSEKAKSEINSYHKNILKIIGINDIEASTKYNLLPLEKVIDKTCINILCKILQEPKHPLTASLQTNPRSTSFNNLYKAKIAKTEAHNQSFLLKYLRIIRDNAKNLQNNKLISKQTSDQLKCKSLILKQSINSDSSNNRTITCQHCGTHVKNTTGLSAHQRLNTKCRNLVATLATLDRHESTRRN